MHPRRRVPEGARWVVLGLLLALAVRPAVGAGPPEEETLDRPALTRTPLEVFADLERLWCKGAADSLSRCLAPDEIRLSLRKMGPRDGIFDSGQARYLLADLFEFARTDSFLFTSYEYDPSSGDPPRAVGRWFFRGVGGIEREARVTIELIARLEGWRISSIEAKRR